MAEGNYDFGLMAGTNRDKTLEELMFMKAATVDEMKAILSTYDTPKENIAVIPFRPPHSSYLYVIDEAYAQRAKQMLFGDK